MVYTSMNDLLPTEEKPSKREITLNTAGATKTAAYAKIVEKLSAKNITVDKFGDEHISDDNTTQLRASELILRLHGDIKPDGAVTTVTVNIGATPEEVASLVAMAADVKRQLVELRSSGKQTGEIIDAEVFS